MDGLVSGNAAKDGATGRGWFIGYFAKCGPPRQQDDIEVKWGVHIKGDAKTEFWVNATATSIGILVQGRFRLIFRAQGQTEEIVLSNPGDYAMWQAGIEHCWFAEEETTLVTVRWPSRMGDQQKS